MLDEDTSSWNLCDTHMVDTLERLTHEAFFHELDVPNLYLPLRRDRLNLPGLPESMLERANIGRQFDAVFHYDRTRAVEPLERSAIWEAGEVPETYPSGV